MPVPAMSLSTEPSTTDFVSLREYEESPAVILDQNELVLLSRLPAGRLEIRPALEVGKYHLRATSWVGAVVLPSMTIQVLPKVVDLRTVLLMFTSSASLVEWDTSRSPYGREALVEGIAELLLHEVEAATRRGLVRGYQHVEERLPVLRGRLDVQALASRPWDVLPVPCRYDDFTSDVAENRVLLAAVRQVSRWPVSPVVRRSTRLLLQRFDGVSDSPAPLLECETVRFSPVNEHYRHAIRLSRLVLEGFGLTQSSGGLEAHSFLVDMNRLFEQWIGEELSLRLWPDFEVAEQVPVAFSRKPRVGMTPDLVIRDARGTRLVADVKYKLTGGLARNEDYYQLLAYATAMELPAGLLIYCRADSAPERVITVAGGGQRLHTYPVDLAGDPGGIVVGLDRLADTVRQLAIARS